MKLGECTSNLLLLLPVQCDLLALELSMQLFLSFPLSPLLLCLFVARSELCRCSARAPKRKGLTTHECILAGLLLPLLVRVVVRDAQAHRGNHVLDVVLVGEGPPWSSLASVNAPVSTPLYSREA